MFAINLIINDQKRQVNADEIQNNKNGITVRQGAEEKLNAALGQLVSMRKDRR